MKFGIKCDSLTGIYQELVRNARMVNIMDSSCKNGSQNLQISENSLGEQKEQKQHWKR